MCLPEAEHSPKPLKLNTAQRQAILNAKEKGWGTGKVRDWLGIGLHPDSAHRPSPPGGAPETSLKREASRNRGHLAPTSHTDLSDKLRIQHPGARILPFVKIPSWALLHIIMFAGGKCQPRSKCHGAEPAWCPLPGIRPGHTFPTSLQPLWGVEISGQKGQPPVWILLPFSPAQNNIPSPFPIQGRRAGLWKSCPPNLVDARALQKLRWKLETLEEYGGPAPLLTGLQGSYRRVHPKTGPPALMWSPSPLTETLCGATRHWAWDRAEPT